ncbi:collagen alpha-1(VII) chain-like isoform X3 [Trichosurus vulpecula]|uniref:collagen alpha-1(VII) chain-like isoform X3 n=1 Tax=Trichosurus vulpecula TaxID=9337 RepID=UPI00186AF854|nr:collagen alpha-1(VII) chain-like isoform X3 [Trichosurus vulpecula]
MGGKEIGEPSRAQMGEGRTTRGRGKHLRARLAWCEGVQVQRLVPSQTPISTQGQQLAELDGVPEPPVATSRRNVNYSRERVPKFTPGVSQMVLHILSLISEQDRANLKGRYPWLDSIGGSGTTREQAGVKPQTGKHLELFQAREQEAGAGGARARLTTLAPGGSEQTLGREEAAEKGPLNDRAKRRRPRSGTGAGKDCFRSEKVRTDYISTSASASTTMSVQGCEVKAQLHLEKSAKGCHENQGPGHGFKKSRGGGPGLKSGVGSTGPSGEEQGLGRGFKKTKGGGSGVKSGVESAGEEQGLGPGYKKTRGGSSGVKSGVESAGEEQGLGPGYKKTKCWGTSLKSGVENTGPNGEEQGLGHRLKKTRGGGSAVKSAVERAGPSEEEQGPGPGYKKTRSGGLAVKSGVESAGPSGEEQALGLGCKKTRGGGSGVKSGVESAGLSGREQGLKPGYKKTKGGGSAVKSAAESTGPSGEEQGVGPGHKKTRGGSPVLKSGVEGAGPSGEEQGTGPVFWKTKREIPGLRSSVESAVPSGEEQVSDSRQMKELEDQPFPDQQTEDKGELTEKELAGPDHVGRPGTQSSQAVRGPEIVWTSTRKAEVAEQFEDDTPDQSFQTRSEDKEGSPLLSTPLPMERPSSDSSYTQPSSASRQPEEGEEAPKVQLVQSPAVPPVHRPGK